MNLGRPRGLESASISAAIALVKNLPGSSGNTKPCSTPGTNLRRSPSLSTSAHSSAGTVRGRCVDASGSKNTSPVGRKRNAGRRPSDRTSADVPPRPSQRSLSAKMSDAKRNATPAAIAL